MSEIETRFLAPPAATGIRLDLAGAVTRHVGAIVPLLAVIVDWEAAGLINPTRELADVALAWSGQTVGEPSEAAFRAVIDGYRKAGGPLADSAYDALHSCLGNWLEWLEARIQPPSSPLK